MISNNCPCGTEISYGAQRCRPCANLSRSVKMQGRAPANTFQPGNPSRTRHGHTSRTGSSPTYRSWLAMRIRCKPGGKYTPRGITVCPQWESFDQFLADMGLRPAGKTLDRINNDGNYEPGNCRWATAKEQAANKRNPWITRRANLAAAA